MFGRKGSQLFLERLANFKITVNNGSTEVWEKSYGHSMPDYETTIYLDNNIVGNIVTITLPGTGRTLTLDEVEVYTKEADLPLFTKHLGTSYSSQYGTGANAGPTVVGYFDDGDYLCYNSLNFGTTGTTTGIILNYAKDVSTGVSAEIRLDNQSGQILRTYSPPQTGGWDDYVTVYVPFDIDVNGVHNLCFTGNGGYGIMSMAWFELTVSANLNFFHHHFSFHYAELMFASLITTAPS